MRIAASTLSLALTLLLTAPLTWASTDKERDVEPVHFTQGSSSAQINGQIKGDHYIDYQLQASAGQTLKAKLQGSNRQNYFNILPPHKQDDAMYVGSSDDNNVEVLLPTDGVYQIRVYLMRAAARRNESSNYRLDLSITGQPLPALSETQDAHIPNTPYHAQASIKCQPSYSDIKECQASVIRRSFDGTATVDLSWGSAGSRSILFVKGQPLAADTTMTFRASKTDDTYQIIFAEDERFDIPAALIVGG
jgi:hypothetical protein